MIDKTTFSQKLLKRPEAKSQLALQRIYLAKKRVQSILDRETVSHQKTLEQKISSQGPTPQRVDPHLLGLAIMDLIETNRLKTYKHSTVSNWHSNIGASEQEVMLRLNDLAPLYASVSKGGFGNLTGDALEVITFKCLNLAYQNNALFAFLGDFKLNEAKVDGRFRKNQPPKFIGTAATLKEADFLQFGHSSGPLCIECKNYREWLYPGDRNIKQLIIKACELQAIPVLLARKIHYSTITNLLYPAGIIAHETYHQYYPSDKTELADKVKHARSLGFSDVLATEEPHPRTIKFFLEHLPKIVAPMAQKWVQNRNSLYDYATENINLAQLYTAIGSPAGGKWIEYQEDPPPPY